MVAISSGATADWIEKAIKIDALSLKEKKDDEEKEEEGDDEKKNDKEKKEEEEEDQSNADMNHQEDGEYQYLFHHGLDSHLPGYTLEEIAGLCRSTVSSQRLFAIHLLTCLTTHVKGGGIPVQPSLILHKDGVNTRAARATFTIPFGVYLNVLVPAPVGVPSSGIVLLCRIN